MKPFLNYTDEDIFIPGSPEDRSVLVRPINSDDVMFFSQKVVSENSANNKLSVINLDEFGMMHLQWVDSAYKLKLNSKESL